MNERKKANYQLLYGIAISATLLASLFVINGHFAQKALAQGTAITNATTKAGNQTSNIGANPSALITQTINATRSTNATNTAISNVINATSSNATGSNATK